MGFRGLLNHKKGNYNPVLSFVVTCLFIIPFDGLTESSWNPVLIRFYPAALILIVSTLLVVSGITIFYIVKRISSLKIQLQAIKESGSKTHKLPVDGEPQSGKTETELIYGFNGDAQLSYKSLVDTMCDGVSVFDNDGRIIFANNAFYSLTGTDKQTLETSGLSAYLHPDDSGYFEKIKNGLKGEGTYKDEIRLKHTDGHYLNISTQAVMVNDTDGQPRGILAVSSDITPLVKHHEELLQSKIQIQESNKLKASFLANISHEIRTPLNSVVGFANLLLSDDLPKEVKEEYVEHINYNSEKLLQIIGDIIDLSRLESAQIEITYEEASISEIVNEVIEDTRVSIKRNEKPIILTVRNLFNDTGDLIFTDRLWLKRVLNHLMDNAVKFTLEGSVELSYSRDEDNIIFKIKDTGIGINKENLARIFEEFRQEITGHHRPFEGLGVGLTLAKEVLERMGGKIFVESEKGIGSEFSFTIPYRPAGRRKIKSDTKSSGPHYDWSTRKCLLVDDNKDVLIYLKRILIDTGINVIMARSGKEAIEMVSSNPELDFVLLDMQMPEMNGIEVTREIRKIRKALPIIAQTAFIFEDDKDIILEAGCDACLIKPIRKDHLITVLSGFIKD